MSVDVQNPYGVDLDYEIKTYEMIGRGDKQKNLHRLKHLVFDFLISIIWGNNRKSKDYHICNTYLDWEEYVYGNFTKKRGGFSDQKDIDKFFINFEHWLIRKKRSIETSLKLYELVMVPLYIGIVNAFSFDLVPLIIGWLIAEMFALVPLKMMESDIDFYNDYMELLLSFKNGGT